MKTKRGTTIAEVLIFIGFIVFVAAILFAVFGRAKENIQRTQCMTNLREVGRAVGIYLSNYDGSLPPQPQNLFWMKPYSLAPTGLINCPTYNPHSEPDLDKGFGFNLLLQSVCSPTRPYAWDGTDLKDKKQVEAGWESGNFPPWFDPERHHSGGVNVVFLDGHGHHSGYAQFEKDKRQFLP